MNKLCKGVSCLVIILLLVFGGVFLFNTFQSRASEVNSELKEEKINEEKAKAVAVDFFDKFTNKKYKDCFNMLNEKLQEHVKTAEGLKDTADNWYTSNANFECVESYADDNIYYTKMLVHTQYRDIYCRVNINKEYLVAGFFRDFELVATKSEDYEESNIRVGEHKLDGLLTLPKGVEKPPVAILVQGSGAHDADEFLYGNRPFADIAYSLAKKGIATLRFNERFYEKSYEFNELNSTVYDEAIDDPTAAIQMMLKDSRVDSNNIFIVGHSLGGFVAPKICELNPEVKGFVSLAGSPRKLVDISLDQWTQRINSLNLSIEEKEKNLEVVRQINDEIRNLDENSHYKEEYGYGVKYWASSNKLNTEETLNKLSIPMCIMQGSEDCQVSSDKDYLEWQRILSGRDNVEFKLYNGLNHCFMKSKGYGISDIDKEYATVEHVNQQVLDDIAAFINKYSN